MLRRPDFGDNFAQSLTWGMRKSIHSWQSQVVGASLKAVRERAGLTQRELCRRLDREHSFVSKYESGERRVDLAEFYWICRACGADPEAEASHLMKTFARMDPARGHGG